jgi:hypothetical protein
VTPDGGVTVAGGPPTLVAAGGTHSCEVTTAGLIKCWGGNASGESLPPSDKVTAVTAGRHTRARCATGATGDDLNTATQDNNETVQCRQQAAHRRVWQTAASSSASAPIPATLERLQAA